MSCEQCAVLLTPQDCSQRLYPAVYTFSSNARPKTGQMIPDLRVEKPTLKGSQDGGPMIDNFVWWRTPVSQLDMRSILLGYDTSTCSICSMFFANITPSLIAGILDGTTNDGAQTYFIYELEFGSTEGAFEMAMSPFPVEF